VSEVNVQYRHVIYAGTADGVPSVAREVTVGFRGVPDPGSSASGFERRLWTTARTLVDQHMAEVGS
jgi:hypothetical protein